MILADLCLKLIQNLKIAKLIQIPVKMALNISNLLDLIRICNNKKEPDFLIRLFFITIF